MSLEGKNIIITGATSGLGVAVATVLSDEGANVFIGGRRADRGAEAAKDTKTTFHTVDVSDQESNRAFFEAAEKHFGGGQNVDAVLLNAGYEGNSAATMIENLDVKAYDDMFNTNVRGVFLGLQYGAPLLRKGGKIVVTSSAGSIVSFSGAPIYAASKSAVDALVRSYGAQFAESEDERIKSFSIVTINPTVYSTEMPDRLSGGKAELVAKMFNPCGRLGKPEELAVIVRDFLHGDLPYKNGDNICIDADTHFPLMEYPNRMKENA